MSQIQNIQFVVGRGGATSKWRARTISKRRHGLIPFPYTTAPEHKRERKP